MLTRRLESTLLPNIDSMSYCLQMLLLGSTGVFPIDLDDVFERVWGGNRKKRDASGIMERREVKMKLGYWKSVLFMKLDWLQHTLRYFTQIRNSLQVHCPLLTLIKGFCLSLFAANYCLLNMFDK